MKVNPTSDTEYGEKETERRREDALKRLLKMPPKPITKPKPEAERKKRGRPPKTAG
jgi:hypothetical protein